MPIRSQQRRQFIVAHARLAGIVLAAAALLLCDPADDRHPPLEHTLVVAVLAPASALDASAGVEQALVERYAADRGLAIEVVGVESALDLFRKVATGEAHVGIGSAGVTRSVFAGFDMAFAAGPSLELAWAVAPNLRTLRDDLQQFFVTARRDGALGARDASDLDASEVAAFEARMRAALPRYQASLEETATLAGLDWRLVAAVAYQESQWDPAATSETGARGFMQLTGQTAQQLRVVDRLDPYASIAAAWRAPHRGLLRGRGSRSRRSTSA